MQAQMMAYVCSWHTQCCKAHKAVQASIFVWRESTEDVVRPLDGIRSLHGRHEH